MVRKRTTILLIAVITILVPSILFAQGDITLESLNARLDALEATMENVTPGLAKRVEAIEALLADPWSPDTIYRDDGVCQSPLHTAARYSRSIRGQIRQETADAYRTTYGVSIDPDDDVYLSSISFAVGSSHVYLEYTKDERKVVEKWSHCEFLGHSEWTETE